MGTVTRVTFPASIAAGATWKSGYVPFFDLNAVSVGVEMTQGGTLTITPYLDNAGNLPIGTPAVTSITAGTVATASVVLTTNAGLSYEISILNSGASAATVTYATAVTQQL